MQSGSGPKVSEQQNAQQDVPGREAADESASASGESVDPKAYPEVPRRQSGRAWTSQESAEREIRGLADVSQRAVDELKEFDSQISAASVPGQVAGTELPDQSSKTHRPSPEEATRERTARPGLLEQAHPAPSASASSGRTPGGAAESTSQGGGAEGVRTDAAPAQGSDDSASSAAALRAAAPRTDRATSAPESPASVGAASSAGREGIARGGGGQSIDRLGGIAEAARARVVGKPLSAHAARPGQTPLTAEDAGEAVHSQALRGLTAAMKSSGGTVTIRLNPEALGALRVEVSREAAKVTATFSPQTPQARDLLMQHSESLRSALEARGLEVERIVIHPPAMERGAEYGPQDGHTARSDAGHSGAWSGPGSGGQDGQGRGDGSGHGRPGQTPNLRAGEESPARDGPAAESAGSGAAGSSGAERPVLIRLDAVA